MDKTMDELLDKVKTAISDAVGTETKAFQEQLKALDETVKALQEARKKEIENTMFSTGSMLNDSRLQKAFDNNSYAQERFADITDKKEQEKFAKDVINHAFLKALITNNTEMLNALSDKNKKALSEGTTTAGGYLVPAVLKNEVYRLITNLGLARQEMTVVPMSSNTLDLSGISTKPTVYWVDEGAQITASDPAFSRDTITAKKLAAICAMSEEVIEDSGVDLINLYIELIAEAMANEEDKSFFNTNSSSAITGLLEDTGVNLITMATGDDAFTDVSYAYLVSTKNAVHPNERRFAKWSIHTDVVTIIEKIVDTTGRPIFNSPVDGRPARLLGYELLENPQMPSISDSAASTKILVFGNFKRYIIGVRKEVTAEVLSEATVATINLAEKASKAIRVIQRLGGATPVPAAFAVLKTGAST